MIGSAAAEEVRSNSSFEHLRRLLREDKYAERLTRPLAFWALPSDRGLPVALLDRPLCDLIDTPFQVLSATPGIGQKKIRNLVRLLNRAVRDDDESFNVTESLSHLNGSEQKFGANNDELADGKLDPEKVSGSVWSTWVEELKAHDVGDEPLGRLAPTLTEMPSVMWNTPLSFYMDFSLHDIRNLKGLGKKKVGAILEVFYELYKVLSAVPRHKGLSVSLKATAISKIEAWIARTEFQSHLPTDEELLDGVVRPLLEQVRIDAGEIEFTIASAKSGINGTPRSIRSIAKELNVSRARIYQLIEEVTQLFEVRWPEGRRQLADLEQQLSQGKDASNQVALINNLATLFYPVEAEELLEA